VKRKFRLRKSADFERVRRLGKSFAHPLIVLIVNENQTESVHVGVATARSLGKAVVRNRAKRLIHAAIQAQLNCIRPGHDLVLIARQPMLDASFQEIKNTISILLRRANVLISYDD